MAIHEYKVTLRRPFKSDTVTAVVHAHHAEDACTQARVHFSNDGELYVAEVQPTAPSHEDDPDRIRVNFRKDLVEASPPLGSLEAVRQLKALCVAITGTLEGEVATSVQGALAEVRRLREVAKDVGVIESRMNIRIESADNQVKMCNADLNQAKEDLDARTRQFKTLMAAAQGAPSHGPIADVFAGAMGEVARLRRMPQQVTALCRAVYPADRLGTEAQLVADSIEEIERLRKVDKDFPSYQDVVALRDKFEEALHVVECAESMLGHRADNAAISTAERGALREYVGRFRTLHPKPGP